MDSHKNSELGIAPLVEAMTYFTDAEGNMDPRVQQIVTDTLAEYNQLIAKLVTEQENNNGSTN